MSEQAPLVMAYGGFLIGSFGVIFGIGRLVRNELRTPPDLVIGKMLLGICAWLLVLSVALIGIAGQRLYDWNLGTDIGGNHPYMMAFWMWLLLAATSGFHYLATRNDHGWTWSVFLIAKCAWFLAVFIIET